MRRWAAGAIGLMAAVTVIGYTGPARAADPLFFSYQGLNCAVSPDGLLGCDLPGDMVVTQRPEFLPPGSGEDLSVPVPGRQITQDAVDGPMHGATLPGTPFTVAGGNPPPVLAPNGCPGQACTPDPPLLGTEIVCGDGHYRAFGCTTGNGHGFSLSQPGRVRVF
ncbi:hypothetical protein [Nocardia sp. alder85J]|uniref:hypothetical protein n=1 Tax=Nocardia sp. alder85J TaxID=2862949 RepID=UPI001CD2FF9E|nr:hypothetical protein [Nocardia sp. alder85J]MCX4091895.1 hypothetical protein [Nocardia sp. alder85J]